MSNIPFSAEFPVQCLASRSVFPTEVLDRVRQTHVADAHALEKLFQEKPSLYIQGQPEACAQLLQRPQNRLAIVGTRRAEPRALQLIDQVVGDLAGTSTVIVSGFALGVDQRAHQCALHYGLSTIAFLGTPLDRDYPRGSLRLRRQILEQGGLLLSEAEPGARVFSKHFLDRNRWIAALCQALWLVQAPSRSGALSTCAHARNFERDVYITPAFPTDRAFAGNLGELERASPLIRPLLGARNFSITWPGLLSDWILGQKEFSYPAHHRSESALAADSDTHRKSAEVEVLLGREIGLRTRLDGGVALDRLLEWSCQQGWEFETFYSHLAEAIQKGEVIDERGWISARRRAPNSKLS